MEQLLWKVTFKVGDPDHDGIEVRTETIEAPTARKAVSKAWYKAGGTPSFWLVKVVAA